MESVEAEGRTVSEATKKALEELGLTREDVEVDILSEGRPRLLGFGGEPAKVVVTPRPSLGRLAEAAPEVSHGIEEDLEEDEELEDGEAIGPADAEAVEAEAAATPKPRARQPRNDPPEPIQADPEEIQAAVEVLEDLVRLMGVEATVSSREPETPGDGLGLNEAVLDIEGDDLGILIGRRGQTLMSLQYVLNLILSRRTNRRVAFGVDVDGYRQRREEALVGLAQRSATRVRSTGKSVTLVPMPPNERRIVHITLAEDASVMTVSIGEGESRKVAITPAQ